MTERIGTFSDKIGNRLVRYFPGPAVNVRTSVPIVSFTFDDIPENAWTNGARILEEEGVRGTFYVSGTFIDHPDTDLKTISAAGCADLVAKGHELGCHTYSHHKLTTFSRKALIDDLEHNDQTLRAFDNVSEKRNFSVPYGMASLRMQPILRDRFATSRSIMPGINRGQIDPYNLAAVELRPDPAYLSDADRWLTDVLSNPGWLVFFTHDVSDDPTFYGCTEDKLRQLIQSAKDGGAQIMTVDAATRALGIVSDSNESILSAAEAISRP
jgi:peptidoglycan/xylan/chitin deacetylase (PgdA/CDA1 family)